MTQAAPDIHVCFPKWRGFKPGGSNLCVPCLDPSVEDPHLQIHINSNYF